MFRFQKKRRIKKICHKIFGEDCKIDKLTNEQIDFLWNFHETSQERLKEDVNLQKVRDEFFQILAIFSVDPKNVTMVSLIMHACEIHGSSYIKFLDYLFPINHFQPVVLRKGDKQALA